MTDWDGRGLPPAVAARAARYRPDGVRTSLLDVPSFVGAQSVGLRPLGEVMGCAVVHLGWKGWAGCGASWGTGRTVTSGSRSRYSGYAPYVDALRGAYDAALARLVAEAVAMRAHGVVGVRLTEQHVSGGREFLALGTAVRADTPLFLERPFVTELDGNDVAALLHAGWAPAAIVYGISVGIRHDDYRTQRQASGWSNAEVSGYTDLVQQVRHDARARFRERVAATGADGALVSRTTLHVHAQEPSDGHVDHVAEATVFGTALARFRTAPTARRTLTVLPLRRPTTDRPTTDRPTTDRTAP
ncbi:MAG: hypothetical protein JWN17_2532 [Frankiales bacterium]|nr:hypothetical protein [Frankiales bacterium]